MANAAHTCAALVLALVGTLCVPKIGHSSIFVVTHANDTNGTCLSGVNCSLREAIQAAADNPGADTVVVPAGLYSVQSSLTPEDSGSPGTVTITGANTNPPTSIINGSLVNSNERVFQIEGGTVILEDLGIQNGPGGGLGIHEAVGGTAVEMNRCVVSDNSTGQEGGGIYVSLATLTINDSKIVNNTAEGGGGIWYTGDDNSPVILRNSIVSGNRSDASEYGGGGIFNGGTMTIESSTVSGNRATNSSESLGGGIRTVGKLTVRNSTISDNTVESTYQVGSGGGIYSGACFGTQCFPGITVTLTNCTVSGNTAAPPVCAETNNYPSSGGGIQNNPGVSFALFNSTVAFNTASVGGGIGGVVAATNTIISDNSSSDCDSSLTSGGYNLDGDGTCGLSGSGDLSNAVASLGPLQNNGGPTETHALVGGSAATEGGNPAGCRDELGNLLLTDQRGVLRPQGLDCDIGAYEMVFTHYLGYSAGNVVQTVTLQDQFGTSVNKLDHRMDLRFFFNPVDKNGEGIPQPDYHLAGYHIANSPSGLSGTADVEITNQFGIEAMTVYLEKPTLLLVPTRKQGHIAPAGLDHYKCYVVDGKQINLPVTLDDQWIDLEPRVVNRAIRLCAPVTKAIGDVTVPAQEPRLHYVLYLLSPGTTILRYPYIENQFEGGVIKARNPRWLLVPSAKKLL